MREITLNGYIDEDVWFGDEITPKALHDMLYTEEQADDVHIRLNSYGGSCNAAVRMHDDIAAYPGHVSITVSGTAASAATVLAMAADTLEMTPGSLWMIHDPSMIAVGNEADLTAAIELLRTSKDSIINVYEKRCTLPRKDIAKMMRNTTWMDANEALENGFIDRITENSIPEAVVNCAVPRDVAEKKVMLWLERHRAIAVHNDRRGEEESRENAEAPGGTGPEIPEIPPEAVSPAEQPETGGNEGNIQPDRILEQRKPDGTPVSQLKKRLALIMPREAESRGRNHE